MEHKNEKGDGLRWNESKKVLGRVWDDGKRFGFKQRTKRIVYNEVGNKNYEFGESERPILPPLAK